MRILNVGLDRDLLCTGDLNEVQKRQIFYSEGLSSHIFHIVKAPSDKYPRSRDLSPLVTVVPCPVSHWFLFFPKAILQSIKILRKQKIDIIQVQDPFFTGLIGLILSKLFRLPLIVGIYSDEIDNPEWLRISILNRIANFIGKYVLSNSTASRTDSLEIKNKLAKYNFPNLVYIPFLITNAEQLSSYDSRSIVIRDNLLNGKKGPLCIAVSRLEKEKNIFLMLDAFAHVAKYNPEILLAIAGSGSLKLELEKYANKVAPNAVRWLGKINNIDMSAYYQASDILLLSSDRESAARVLSEAMLAGTTIISTDTAGAKEVIDDGVTGVIVPVGDVDKFAEELHKLTNNHSKIKQMGAMGKCRAQEKVSSKVILDKLNQLYASVLRSF